MCAYVSDDSDNDNLSKGDALLARKDTAWQRPDQTHPIFASKPLNFFRPSIVHSFILTPR